jgi:haloalkane dehalogenase
MARRSARQSVDFLRAPPHTTITNAGHFVQEDQGPELVAVVTDFIRSTAVSLPEEQT